MAELFVIWSEEHGAWWGSDETNLNYTRALAKARRYTKEAADRIVHDANAFLEVGEWREVAIADPLAAWQRRGGLSASKEEEAS
jgi:hypothetical protein